MLKGPFDYERLDRLIGSEEGYFLVDRGAVTEARRMHDGSIAIRLYHTDILRYYPNGDVYLYAGKWQSVTTKRRMNEYLPASVRVSAEKRLWYVYVGGYDEGERHAFTEGMKVNLETLEVG